MTDFDQIAPRPQATIEAIRSIGYSFATAIADIVDNSLPVNASLVEVLVYADGKNSWCAVIDDGDGMSEEELREAMRLGSGGSTRIRKESDLGRFGIGLKSAGFSQARVVSVFSKRSGMSTSIRVWDIDHLGKSEDWEALKTASETANRFMQERLGEHGTIVFLEKLDGSLKMYSSDIDVEEAQRILGQEISELSVHLSRVFGRYLTKNRGVKIRLNGVDVEPWIPFLEHPATQELPSEDIHVANVAIRCRAFVLPHPDMLTGISSEEKNRYRDELYELQGFYLYRKDRLVTGSTWLDPSHRRENETALARVELEIPDALDESWELTVDKASFRPPRALRADLRRLAELSRSRSRAVYRNRGVTKPVRQRGQARVIPLIELGSQRGRAFARLNESHPLVQQLLELPNRQLVRAFIGVANDSITRVIGRGSTVPSELPNDVEIPNEIRECAVFLFERFAVHPDLKRSQIRDMMLSMDPFVSYPSVVEEIIGQCDD